MNCASDLPEEQVEKAAEAAWRAVADLWGGWKWPKDCSCPDEWRLAARTILKLQYPSQPLDGELVEQMIDAWFSGSAFGESSASGTCLPEHVRRMEAALRVAIDRMLGDVTDEENEEVWFRQGLLRKSEIRALLNRMFANRRAKLSQPKTPQERVTVCAAGCGSDYAGVFLDGKQKWTGLIADAEIYAEGVRSKLSREQK